MKTIYLFIAVILIGSQLGRAAEATAPDKNKSNFALDANQRNPFWPIGWKPAVKTGTAETAGPDISPNVFLVSSITLGEADRFAIINGKAMKEGQQFGLQIGNQTYQVTLKEIQDGKVVLLRRNQEIVVPLHRK